MASSNFSFWLRAAVGGVGQNPAKPTLTTRPDYPGLTSGCRLFLQHKTKTFIARFGPSPKAFLVVPLVGAFFIDLLNASVIKFFIAVITRFLT